MFKVSREQMQSFAPLADEAFATQLVQHLREHYGRSIKGLDEPTVTAGVRQGIERARRYGLLTERSMAVFVTLLFTVHVDFDAHPAVRAVLEDASQSPEDRLMQLFWRELL